MSRGKTSCLSIIDGAVIALRLADLRRQYNPDDLRHVEMQYARGQECSNSAIGFATSGFGNKPQLLFDYYCFLGC